MFSSALKKEIRTIVITSVIVYCILMLFLPILAAKIDYVFHTAMGRLVLLKHCVSVILWSINQMRIWHFKWHGTHGETAPSVSS